MTRSNYIMHIIASLDEKVTSQEVDIYISNFLSYNIITKKKQSF